MDLKYRIYALLIDFLIVGIFINLIVTQVVITVLSSKDIVYRMLPALIFFSGITFLFFHSQKYGGSLGKKIMGLKVVTLEKTSLSLKTRTVRSLPYLLFAVSYFGGLIEVGLHYEGNLSELHFNLNQLILSHGGVFGYFVRIFFFVILIDLSAACLNSGKRALHDILTKTIVIDIGTTKFTKC